MNIFTIRNIISASIGLNIAGPPLFFSFQNFSNGEFVLGVFLFVVGICGLVLPEYLIRKLFEQPVKESVSNTKKRAEDISESAINDVEDISNEESSVKDVVESISEQTRPKESLTNISDSVSERVKTINERRKKQAGIDVADDESTETDNNAN